jgi:hypothetical protein
MSKKIEIIKRAIETYLFGEYFKQLAQGQEMEYINGSIDTQEANIKIPRFDSIDECKELIEFLGKEIDLIDSKYKCMGTYIIHNIELYYIENFNGIEKGYCPKMKVRYNFDKLNWKEINKNLK